MMRPNFFIVGAPKCGTTALSEYLREHPRVFVSTPKEPGYFALDLPGLRYTRTLAGYENLFAAAGPQHLAIGEASPGYLFSTAAAEAIHAYTPDARIIVMLRNPIEMLVSYHNQLCYSLFEDHRDLAEAWALQEARRAGRQLPPDCREPRALQYAEIIDFPTQLRRFQALFPAERLLVLLYDELVADPAAIYRRTLEFLGVPDDGRDEFPVVNARKAPHSALVNRLLHRPPAFLVDMMQRLAGTRLHDLLVYLHGLLKRANSRATGVTSRQRPAHLPPALYAELTDRVRPVLDDLATLIGRDLSHWDRGRNA